MLDIYRGIANYNPFIRGTFQTNLFEFDDMISLIINWW